MAIASSAQQPGAMPRPLPLPPLLYVQINGPAGMQVTFYRAGLKGETLPVPFVVGLRPGYVYQVEISGLKSRPEAKLYPTLEVRGSIQMPLHQRGADYPATLVFRDADIAAVLDGALVTKVIAIERPERAYPLATKADEPLEFDAGPERDPVLAAQEHGRPLLVARLGQRQFAPNELAQRTIPGTILLPREKVLAPPRALPWVSWTCVPLFDPLLGPAPPARELCFHDGGDQGLHAGYDRQGRLVGLQPSDTVAEYADAKGQRRIAVSNRVCLCVPRFIVTRHETAVSSKLALVGPGNTRAALGQGTVQSRTQPLEQHQNEHLAALASRQRTSSAHVPIGTAVTGRVDGLNVVSTLRETGQLTGVPQLKPAPTELGDLPLLLDKWPDKCTTAIGEIVTFYLKYTNRGGRPVTQVAVSDSLPARLEYVPGSARSDRDTVFTTQPNEAGSLILRWELNGSLPPGQSGLVSFQARIR